jgi:hypothetical protein
MPQPSSNPKRNVCLSSLFPHRPARLIDPDFLHKSYR